MRNGKAFGDRLAVCSWSLQPEGPEDLVAAVLAVQIPRLHIALDPIRLDHHGWNKLQALCAKSEIALIAGMFGTAGEDYSTIESIRRSGGIVPDSTWDENWRNIQTIGDIASDLRLRYVTFHAGFLPDDENDPTNAKLLDRVSRIADIFRTKNIPLLLETGQETAETLKSFLMKLGKSNVGVNFDPANMILYNSGEPIQALELLSPWVKHCHIKDANATHLPGSWGEEVVVGTGQVDWMAFFHALEQVKFDGCFAIEREAGSKRIDDIRRAKAFIEQIDAAGAIRQG